MWTAFPPSDYYGGLDCGEASTMGDPELADSPYVGFVMGPDNGTKDEPPCAGPVKVTSNNDGTTQTVEVGAVDGYEWGGITGIVTIEWDAENPATAGVPRTVQVKDTENVIIPWCAVVVAVSPVPDSSGDPLWYYKVIPNADHPDALYGTATGTGDTCLISQETRTVDVGGTLKTQTVEVFYIWNDPKFLR